MFGKPVSLKIMDISDANSVGGRVQVRERYHSGWSRSTMSASSHAVTSCVKISKTSKVHYTFLVSSDLPYVNRTDVGKLAEKIMEAGGALPIATVSCY